MSSNLGYIVYIQLRSTAKRVIYTYGLSVEKSDRKELRIFLYWQENTLSIVAILCNNVLTGLQPGNYSSFISNFLPLLRPIAGDK